MVKRYLNAKEKSDLVKLTTFFATLEEMSDSWADVGRPKDIVKYLRMAKSLIDKVCFMITAEIDDDAAENIMTFAKKVHVKVVHKDEFRREHEKMLKMDEVVPMKIDDLYDVIEICGEYCRLHCKEGVEGVKECKARQIMLQYDVPVARTKLPQGECPYKL